jgi:hypothetical protein
VNNNNDAMLYDGLIVQQSLSVLNLVFENNSITNDVSYLYCLFVCKMRTGRRTSLFGGNYLVGSGTLSYIRSLNLNSTVGI